MAKLIDGTGTVVFEGEVEGVDGLPPAGLTGQVLTKLSNADGDADWENAAPAAPTARGQYASNFAVAINDGAGARIPWDLVGETTPLLNLGDPLNPAAIASGVYAIAAVVAASVDAAMTAGGWFQTQLRAFDDTLANNPEWVVDSPPASVGHPLPSMLVAATYFLAAGDQLRLFVVNHDGAAQRHFALLLATVQRIS